MLSPTRPFRPESFCYSFGNERAVNILKGHEFQIHIESDPDVTNILLLLCGDLMTTLEVTTVTKGKQLNIHLNDSNKLVLARNILIWKIITAQDFNPDNKEDVDFLWDVWYNAEWPKTTKKRFQYVVKDLLDENLPENIFVPDGSQFQVFLDVWKAWYSICTKSRSESALLAKKVCKGRKIMMIEEGCFYFILDYHSGEDALFSRVVHGLTSQIMEDGFGNVDLNKDLENNIADAAHLYFKTGSSRIRNQTKTMCINPTLVDPTTHSWQVYFSLCPFESYLPLSKEELDMPDKDGTLIRSCQKILKSLLVSYRERKETVKIFVHLGDPINFCCTESSEKFNIIDSSSLADLVGLANVLNVCRERLVNTQEAVLLTKSKPFMNCPMKKCTLENYVEEAVFCPLSMIPTIYGMRLEDHVKLGATNLFLARQPIFTLRWQKAPTPRNLTISCSPTLDRFQEHLAARCFDLKSRKSKELQSGKHREMYVPQRGDFGMCGYSPLSFKYIVDSMVHRFGGDQWLKSAHELNIPPAFNLAIRTADAWNKGDRVVKLSASSIPDPEENSREEYFLSTRRVFTINRFSETRQDFRTSFRIILRPSRVFPDERLTHSLYLDPNVHCIDNFDLDIVKIPDSNTVHVSISFLLLPKHGLEETHVAMLYDLVCGTPIFGVFLNSMRNRYTYKSTEEFQILSGPSTSLVGCDEESNMKVESCVETKDQYVFKIRVKSFGCDISDLKVTTDQRRPCESCHQITLSSAEPCGGLKPLILSLPHPVFAEDIPANLEIKQGFVDLELTKSLLEPWPYEFQLSDEFKWVVNCLKPWKKGKNCNCLGLHLQYQASPVACTLTDVRRLITFLFMQNSDSDKEFFQIRVKGSPSPDWWLRLHKPIFTSPLGAPILLLSAYDVRLAVSLEKEGKWKKRAIDEELLAQPASIVLSPSSEVSQLLRYVLRLNSIRIMPTTWQKDNLRLDENSPWLATYISPLYLDHVECKMLGITALLDGLMEKPNVVDNISFCGACKKVSPNLKRCARCQSILYCSIECQHTHWPQHKSSCVKK